VTPGEQAGGLVNNMGKKSKRRPEKAPKPKSSAPRTDAVPVSAPDNSSSPGSSERLIQFDSNTLHVNATDESLSQFFDLDRAFVQAVEEHPNLNAVDLFIGQKFLLDHVNADVVLTAGALTHFLKRKLNILRGFKFCLGSCCGDEFMSRTDGGRALLPLGSMPILNKLTLINVGFGDASALTGCLNTDLQSLQLDYIQVGRYHKEWNPSDVTVLAQKISQMSGLVSLCVANTPFADAHLETILPNLPNLKHLDVSGNFGEGAGPESKLTDAALEAIAENCPHLQSLSVNYQRRVTMNGLKGLLIKLPNLLELEVSDLPSIKREQVCELLLFAENLRFLRFGAIGERLETHPDDVLIGYAIADREGKVVVCTEMGGLIQVPLIPKFKENQEKSMALIEESNDNFYDPLTCDKWKGITA